MKKRIAACLLLLTMLLGTAAVPPGISAAETEHTHERDVLTAVGIYRFADGAVDPNIEGIFLGNFLVLIENVLGGSFDTYSDEVLNAAIAQGLLEGEKASPFRFVEYSDAVEIAKRALNYGNYLDGTGANNLLKWSALTKGISNTGSKLLSYDNALKLIYNLSTMDGAYELVGIGSNGKRLKYNKNRNLLSKYRDIYEVRGVITENRYTSMYEEGSLSGNDLRIEDEIFRADVDYSDFFGTYVNAFVYISDREDEGSILYMEKNAAKNKELSVAAEDLIEWNRTKTQLSYYADGRRKRASINKTAAFLYNDVVCTEFSNVALLPEDGSVDLIDNDGDGQYDVVKITANEYVAVESVSVANGNIYSKYSYDGALNSLSLETDDKDVYVEISKNGQNASLKDIKEWDILTVRKSFGEKPKLTRIEICDEKITDEAEEVNLSEKTVTLAGEEYTLSEALIHAMNHEGSKARVPSVEEEYTYYFAANGKIAGVYGELTDSARMGYLTKVGKRSGPFDDIVQIRLFENNGEWHTFNLASKVIFNGERLKSSEVFPMLVSRQVISFQLNSSGEIRKIMTAKATTEQGYDGFSRTGKINAYYRTLGRCFDNRIFLSTEPFIFAIPADEENALESDYRMASVSSFEDNHQYSLEAYNVDEFGVTDTLVVNLATTRNAFAVLDGIGEGLDVDGAPQKLICGKIDSYIDFSIPLADGVTTFTNFYDSNAAEHSLNELKKGDILLLTVSNGEGNVEQIRRLHTLADGPRPRQTGEPSAIVTDFSNFASTNNFDVIDKYTAAEVVKTDSQNALILMNYIYDFGSRTQSIKVINSATSYTVIDSKSGRTWLGGFTDVEPGDYVFIEVNASYARNVFIIK